MHDTLFWFDQWCGNGTFKYMFPNLYKLENKKHCKVNDVIQIGGATWDWVSIPSSSD